jgi:hypothetical protein
LYIGWFLFRFADFFLEVTRFMDKIWAAPDQLQKSIEGHAAAFPPSQDLSKDFEFSHDGKHCPEHNYLKHAGSGERCPHQHMLAPYSHAFHTMITDSVPNFCMASLKHFSK